MYRRFPVLLQGETSVGKTSLISFLARRTGNVCHRINNHEHTDTQEYMGAYAADQTGRLVFREGESRTDKHEYMGTYRQADRSIDDQKDCRSVGSKPFVLSPVGLNEVG